MSTELPNWVYDVVIALEKWADSHPVLLGEFFDIETNAFVVKRTDDCGCGALELVPGEVRDKAATIARYTATQ